MARRGLRSSAQCNDAPCCMRRACGIPAAIAVPAKFSTSSPVIVSAIAATAMADLMPLRRATKHENRAVPPLGTPISRLASSLKPPQCHPSQMRASRSAGFNAIALGFAFVAPLSLPASWVCPCRARLLRRAAPTSQSSPSLQSRPLCHPLRRAFRPASSPYKP